MAAMARPILAFLVTFTIFFSAHSLSHNYYDKTCPNLESIVTNAVKKAMSNDRTVPAALLRMHFHDCFIRLLKSTKNNVAEKDGPPNISLHAFYVIDHAKEAIEKACPGIVSCADILALAAKDAVALSGGPNWKVPKGRLDVFNISQLQQSFSQRGLSLKDLVALSGGHTLGFAHCSSFKNRIHKFSPNFDVDSTLNPSFAANLKKVCPSKNTAKNAGSVMDPTTFGFDNVYYKMMLSGKSIFSSDQALLTNPKTKALVSKFAASDAAFKKAFVKSMIKMSSLTGGQEIRRDCKVVR
ncbi:Peroxidase 64 [Linum perenne]